jgi:hypothetical protein
MTDNLSTNQKFCLTHISMFGSAAYPIRKAAGKWFVDGIRGCGACPTAFKTKKEAVAQFEKYHDLLLDYNAGRVSNPERVVA